MKTIGAAGVSETASSLIVDTSAGSRSVELFHYAQAGHMITMAEPHAFANDFAGWLAARASH